jgi:acetyltransferase-like isoleucine patch superfamily enzyme
MGAELIFRFLYRLFFAVQSFWFKCLGVFLIAELKHSAIRCGANVHIYYPFRIGGLKAMDIGNNVHINRGAFIRADGGLKIGDNVHIGPNLVIYTVNHNYKGGALPYDETNSHI